MSYAKNWCFTINNYGEDDIQSLQTWYNEEKVSYLVYGFEKGEQGTPHIQGYLQANKKIRLSGLKKWHPTAHFEVAKGTADQNRKYCSKDGLYTELGSISRQGARQDLEGLMLRVKEGVTDYSVLRDEYPMVCARYTRFVKDYIKDHQNPAQVACYPLYKWQGDLYQELMRVPDDRTIQFIVDPKGNQGKTWFAKYYTMKHPLNTQYMESTKKDNLAYALKTTTRVLFVNVTRQQVEFLNYSFLESVKDGMVFSPKYESCTKIMAGKVHVVVLMNQDPDMKMLSEDRYKINYIS